MQRARIVLAHRAKHTDPIQLTAGDVVRLGDRDSQWPAFVWATTADGRSGWAAMDWLRRLDDGQAEALRDYSSREANADVGEDVVLCWEYGGWHWVIKNQEEFGWIPSAHLEIEPEQPEEEPSAEDTAHAWIQYWANGAHNDRERSDPYVWASVDADWLLTQDPEKLWQVIQSIYVRPEARAHFGVLAAGPLEDLLGSQGDRFIERIEQLARRDPTFAFLLGGVWQYTMPADLWARVQAAQDLRGWDGIPPA